MLITKNKSNWIFIVIVIILAILAGAGVLYYIYYSVQQTPSQTENTLSPPPDEILNWKIHKDQQYGFEFRYPENFGANVWKAFHWPPVATAVPDTQDPVQIGCPDIANTGLPIDGVPGNAGKVNYTLFKGSDIGAGQLYSTYCYVIENGNNYYVLDFTIWSHNGCQNGECGAYCGTQYEQECRNLDRVKQIEQPIEKMVSTFSF